MLYLRLLVAGVSPQRPGFDHSKIYVELVVDTMELEQILLLSSFSLFRILPALLHMHNNSSTFDTVLTASLNTQQANNNIIRNSGRNYRIFHSWPRPTFCDSVQNEYCMFTYVQSNFRLFKSSLCFARKLNLVFRCRLRAIKGKGWRIYFT